MARKGNRGVKPQNIVAFGFLIDRVSAISNLPEGVYKILWKDVGCYPYWQRKDEVEDVFSWWIEEAIEGQMCLFDMPEWIDNI